MKIRVAWKMWMNGDFSPRYNKAMRTIEARTRRYYNKQAKKALKNGSTMMYKFYIHIGQICLTLKEVYDTPDTFINYLIRRNRLIWN